MLFFEALRPLPEVAYRVGGGGGGAYQIANKI